MTEDNRNCLFEQRLIEVIDELDAILEANPDSVENKEPAHKVHVVKLLEDKLQANIIIYEAYNEFSINNPFYAFRLTAPNLYFQMNDEECDWGMPVPDYNPKEGESAIPKNRNGVLDIRFQLDENAKQLSHIGLKFSPRLNIPKKEDATYKKIWPGHGIQQDVFYLSESCHMRADLGEGSLTFYQVNHETGKTYARPITGKLGLENDSIAYIKIAPVIETGVRNFLERGALNAVFKMVGYHGMDKVVR